MNREFLKEAISDAKTMKESAIANAKVALEEAFSPQLHAMFASKIEEMDKKEMDEGYDEMDEAEEMDEEMSNPVMRKGDRGDNKAERETEYMREEEDMDLDEILAELEKGDMDEEMRKDGMDEEMEDKKSKELNEAESDEDAEEEGYLDGMKDEKEDMDMDDEDIDIEDMSEDDLKDFIEDVIADMVASGELEAGEGAEMEDKESEDEDIDIEVEDDEEVTIDEDARTDAEEEGYLDGMKDEKEDMDEEMDLKNDLKEAMETVATLRSELNEINLLNSKLLYANKIFKATNMTESQKAKVLSAFDKAATVNEVKIVFSTISDNTTFTKKTIKEGVRGSASKPMHTPKVTKKKPIVESDEMVSRFKKLAGII